MRDAARALDDVSDHLGEVLRHADQLLTEWSGFGAQVRAQVEREVAAIGTVVDGAVARAAGAGIDRAVTDRLRALSSELERLEQRTRAASRAVVEHREADRRVLWIAVAGVVLANALLVVLLLRKPVAAPVAEPVRIEAPAPAPSATAPLAAGSAAAGSGDAAAGSASEVAVAPAVPEAGSNVPDAGSAAGSAAPGGGSAAAGSNAPSVAGKPAAHGTKPAALKPSAAPIALPPKPGVLRPHKKQP